MVLTMKAHLLEVIADSFEGKDGKEVEFYKAQIWQPGEGVAAVSISKEAAEKCSEGMNVFVCDIQNGKVRITGVEE